MPTTRRVDLIDKHKLVKIVLNKASETFVVYIAVLERPVSIMMMHPITKSWLVDLKQDKTLTEISIEYSDFANVFSSNLAMELPDCAGINKYTIELIIDKPSPYSPISSLILVELETLKMYIETYLKTGFIRLFKSPI